MSELGNRLKLAREEKNLSLNDLQEMTKIQKRYLLALEEGNYAIIPGKFYVRAFIKQYAEAVNLDPDTLFEEYKSEIPSTKNDELPENLSRVKTHRELPKNASKFLEVMPKILTVVVILGIFVAIWLWKQNSVETDPKKDSITNQSENEYSTNVKNISTNDENVDNSTDENKVEEDKVTEERPPEQETPKTVLTKKEVAGSTTTFELTGAEKLELEVNAKSRTWVSIKNDKGKTFFANSIDEGKSEIGDYTQEAELTIRVGNVPGTDVKINGELVPIENPKITPQNIKIINKKE
ncbi:helix-turn-helix domain-containing protein [Metabacillus malikii]|uniref:Cytoskeletal protein RodZ n=1 Tax=Metabacillus malikii TaxID=1504265 RepID=A0ABT9ZFX7_9BACI|nr:RodZ family helix-turn-helix domain-containing protein [Metabacillus malikii]MDQ0230463.1 cytoskeletal protein RodZ [Metabacillus malikii]